MEEVTAYLRGERIATFKIPERLEVVPRLPLRGDKIDRTALRRSIEDQVTDAAAAGADRS